MALIQCDFFSEVLQLSCSMTVLLPQRPYPAPTPSPKYPTLYLLPGMSNNHTAWQRQTSIERHVEEKEIAVVMPAVYRSCYTDMAHGLRYWTYISEELPAIAQDLFPLSAKREDNFVAGVSMGGYGAFKLALRQPDRFAAAASLSGAMDAADWINIKTPGWDAELHNIFGDVNEISGSNNDLFHLAAQAAKSNQTKPKLFQWCGTEDFLYASNVKFRDYLQTLPLDLTYFDGPGGHSWEHWDVKIQQVLNWLPL